MPSPRTAQLPPGNGRHQDHLELRLGRVEQELGRVTADMRVMGHELGAVKADVGRVMAGIEQLLARDVRRGEPKSWLETGKALLIVFAVLAGIAVGLDYYLASRFGDVRKLIADVDALRARALEQKLLIERLESAIAWTPSIRVGR